MITREFLPVLSNPGIRVKPSTALSILIAGVITPSPKSRDIPMKERRETNPTCLLDFNKGISISRRTMVPPSPFWPRLIASHAYSTVTTIIRVQIIRERIPITWAKVGGVNRKITVRVYMGLVPISPKTSPSIL